MSTYLITGAGRGIGLELTKQLAQLDNSKVSKVLALSRGQLSTELSQIRAAFSGRVINITCDVTMQASISEAVRMAESELQDGSLDVLINNVGMQKVIPGGVCAMSEDDLFDEFNVNVLSAHRITKAFLPLLRKGKEKTIVNMSTSLGSLSHASRFMMAPTPGYKITKTALNMLTVQYALELEQDGFTVVALSPGWLKTDMGTSYAELEVQPGVQAALKRILGLGPELNGHFLSIHMPGWENAEGPNQYDGGELPW